MTGMTKVLEALITKKAFDACYAEVAKHIEDNKDVDPIGLLASEATEAGFRISGCCGSDGDWSASEQRRKLRDIARTIGGCYHALSRGQLAALSYAVLKLMDDGFDPALCAESTHAFIKDNCLGGAEKEPEKELEKEPMLDKTPVTVTLSKFEFELIHDAAMFGAHRMIDKDFDGFDGMELVGIASKLALAKLREELCEEGETF